MGAGGDPAPEASEAASLLATEALQRVAAAAAGRLDAARTEDATPAWLLAEAVTQVRSSCGAAAASVTMHLGLP